MQESYLGQVMLVGIGGFVGSVARFMASGLAHRLSPATTLPIGTLVVNVAGCLLIGVLGGLVDVRQALAPAYRLFLMIGVLGGFTTFSTFSFETLQLAQQGDLWRAFANVALQVVLGLAAAWLGFVSVRFL
jgi:CrcB protein